MNSRKQPQISDLQDIICEAIPDMLILCDTDTTILDILHPVPELISTNDLSTLIGRRITDKKLKNAIDAGFEQMETVIRTRQPSRFVFCRTGSHDGKPHHYEVS